MENHLSKILKESKIAPDEALSTMIWDSIKKREARIARIKFFTSSTIGLFTLVSIVPAFSSLTSNLSQSGFYEYLSLLFSEGTIALTYSKEIFLSLAEALPTNIIAMNLSLIFMFLVSVRYASKNIRGGIFPTSNLFLSI